MEKERKNKGKGNKKTMSDALFICCIGHFKGRNLLNVFFLLLFSFLSFFFGFLFGKDEEKEKFEFKEAAVSTKVPFVEISGISDRKIFGNLKEGRIKIGNEIFFNKGKFSTDIDKLMKRSETNLTKEIYKELNLNKAKEKGFLFVGSKSSKKLHSIESSHAKRISPENRVFIKDLSEAKELGFIK